MAKLKRWEYTTTYINQDNRDLQLAKLNAYGEMGWELVLKVNDYGIFKRQKISEKKARR